MNRQPYQTPPRWWSPRLSPNWIRLLAPLRRRRALREHGLSQVELHGAEHLQNAMAAGHGVLITPNHSTHADPYALQEVSDRLRSPFYFMTAWQVFAMTHRIGRRVLQHHGSFSINREDHDLRAYRQAVRILEGNRPLVIFPEGEVFHLNDRVMQFRRGAATAALRAARRSDRPVACLPCAMKFRYLGDPLPKLLGVMARLEQRMGLSSPAVMPLVGRIRRLADGVLSLKEIEYFGRTRDGSAHERTGSLLAALLARLEDRYRVLAPPATVPERVKELRRRAIRRREQATVAADRAQAAGDLDDLFFVMQLFSYPADYLAGKPSLERLAETVDKLEEDVLRAPTAGLRGTRRVDVAFGEPVMVRPGDGPLAAPAVTEELRRRVQALLDGLNGSVALDASPESSSAAPSTELVAPTPELAAFAAA
jgi:1-acyl-sn-glycerol-3-phosphate acyltransferase